MNKVGFRKWISVLVAAFVVFNVTGIAIRPTSAASPTPQDLRSFRGEWQPVVVRHDPTPSKQRILAPVQFSRMSVKSADIQVNYLPAGAIAPLGETCEAWPGDAITAFEYAASIWESLVNSPVTIIVDACWTQFSDPDVLGYGGADNYYRNFSGAPQADTWYPSALANALSGTDLGGSGAPDIAVAYGKTFNWYFGADGNPAGATDFASVVLHELCHGLGFSGSMRVASGMGSWGGGTGMPISWDRFAENGGGQSLINTSLFPNPSAALAAQLTGGDIFFNGANANAANGGQRPELFAPSTWMQGSSYSHLDYVTFDGTENSLMVYAISPGEAMHNPGPIALGILTDIGWTITSATPAPTVSGITPSSGYNYGATSITNLVGTDFQASATVKLARTGQPDIVATNVNVVSDKQITCNFNLTGAVTGVWDVVVTNPDSQSATLTDGFTVNALPLPQITSVDPVSATNAGGVTGVILSGGNFLTTGTTEVKLTKAGQTDLLGTNVSVVSATQITADFDLLGADMGQWTVIVTNPDGQSGTLTNGFEVLTSLTAPTLVSIAPPEGGNTQTIQSTLYGTNFITTGTTIVKLTKAGHSDIIAGAVHVISTTQMTVIFDLNGAAGGLWNVMVTNPNGEGAMMRDSFTIHVDKLEIYLPLVTNKYATSTPTQNLINGDFETGATGWTEYSSHGWDLIISADFPGSITPHGGSWAVWLGGDLDDVSYIEQQVTVLPSVPYLAYWHWIASADVCGYDVAKVIVDATNVVDTYDLCSSSETGGWVMRVVNMSAYAGQTVSLQLRVETDASDNSNLFIDDVVFQSTP